MSTTAKTYWVCEVISANVGMPDYHFDDPDLFDRQETALLHADYLAEIWGASCSVHSIDQESFERLMKRRVEGSLS